VTDPVPGISRDVARRILGRLRGKPPADQARLLQRFIKLMPGGTSRFNAQRAGELAKGVPMPEATEKALAASIANSYAYVVLDAGRKAEGILPGLGMSDVGGGGGGGGDGWGAGTWTAIGVGAAAAIGLVAHGFSTGWDWDEMAGDWKSGLEAVVCKFPATGVIIGAGAGWAMSGDEGGAKTIGIGAGIGAAGQAALAAGVCPKGSVKVGKAEAAHFAQTSRQALTAQADRKKWIIPAVGVGGALLLGTLVVLVAR